MIEHVQHHWFNGEDHLILQSWDQTRNGTEEIFRRIHDVERKYSQLFNEKFLQNCIMSSPQ